MREEKVLKDAVVCFLVKADWIMLMFKTDKIGKDCRNGPGGGVKKGEDIVFAAKRELFEESGVMTIAKWMEKVAEVDFHNMKSDGSMFICKVHYFFVYRWLGVPESRPKENMINPTWFSVYRMPYGEMMPADEDFMEPILWGYKVKAEAFLGPFQKEKIAPTQIEFVEVF